ncbi:MAG: tRNA dimethylallyltransferase, partial [Candidatus Paceibacterota bacterium]
LKKKLKYDALIIGIKRPQKELEERIYKRLVARLKEGMIDEIKRLHESGVSWKRLDNFGLEYRYVSRYLRGLLDYDQMVDETYRAIKRYAKRQMTWFKRNKDIVWVDDPRGAIKLLSAFPQA